jgi:protein associated with RNAse G/E
VNLPPTLQASQLDYVDLDIDLLVKTKNNLRILDEDEFERNRSIHNYDDATVSAAQAAIVELKEMISQGSFPFDTLPD